MLWVLGRFWRVSSFLVRLETTILFSCIVIDSWFVLWLLSYLNNLSFFIVIDTYFVHWLFSSLNNSFLNIVIDTCKENLALRHIMKFDSIEWLFTDFFFFFFNNLILHGVINLNFSIAVSQDLNCGFQLTKLIKITLLMWTFPPYHF